ncbi:Hypp9690 [Branchiostoma lanceolatum]|uniref:Hypp9690 protein n=1 Tax=Branchiostoma lanceolatum TaxID=7740 RepID=A0A8S4MNT6_BRALA|nr:Hypp9690 [Branchiostoma lanceolatum]
MSRVWGNRGRRGGGWGNAKVIHTGDGTMVNCECVHTGDYITPVKVSPPGGAHLKSRSRTVYAQVKGIRRKVAQDGQDGLSPEGWWSCNSSVVETAQEGAEAVIHRPGMQFYRDLRIQLYPQVRQGAPQKPSVTTRKGVDEQDSTQIEVGMK